MWPESATPVRRAATGFTPRKSYSSQPSRPSSRSAACTAAMSSDMRSEYSSARRPYNRRVSPPPDRQPRSWPDVRRVLLMTSALPSVLQRTIRRAWLVGALASAALVAPSAQTPAPTGTQQPVRPPAGAPAQPPAQAAPAADAQQIPPVTFRAEIEYVEVDAVVTDERGNLVKGLSREDFDVFEDGVQQKVSFFSQVVIP